MEENKKWYLLFDGSSPDGLGSPIYIGRTIDKDKAEQHYNKVRNNPYSTGKVMVVTDDDYRSAWICEEFE